MFIRCADWRDGSAALVLEAIAGVTAAMRVGAEAVVRSGFWRDRDTIALIIGKLLQLSGS
jgi:hypothetical protein